MKLHHIGSNVTTIEVGDATILFSYDTPVAAHIVGRGFLRTSEHYSATTSRHINKWLRKEGSGEAEIVSPDFLSSLLS